MVIEEKGGAQQIDQGSRNEIEVKPSPEKLTPKIEGPEVYFRLYFTPINLSKHVQNWGNQRHFVRAY